jgi:hypothetical protein
MGNKTFHEQLHNTHAHFEYKCVYVDVALKFKANDTCFHQSQHSESTSTASDHGALRVDMVCFIGK